jgi:hypothetical protein
MSGDGRERGGIVLGWLFKLVVSLAIVGVIAFEAGAVIVARVDADSAATEVASDALEAFRNTHDADKARQVAVESAAEKGVSVDSFSASGEIVEVTVSKRARSIVLKHIGAPRDWTIARVTRRVALS